MYEKALEKLNNLQDAINEDLKKFETDRSVISNIRISVATYCQLLNRTAHLFTSNDESENTELRKKFKELKKKIEKFRSLIKSLEEEIELEKNKKIEVELALTNSRNYGREKNNELNDESDFYYENSLNVDSNRIEDNFSIRSTRRVNSFIMTAMDSLDSLKRQGAYIDNTRDKIKNGLISLGLSNQIVDSISKRYLTDYYFFLAGIAILIILFIFIKFFT